MTDTDPPSLAPCLRCGAEVATSALRCPHCALTFPTVAGDDADVPPDWSASAQASPLPGSFADPPSFGTSPADAPPVNPSPADAPPVGTPVGTPVTDRIRQVQPSPPATARRPAGALLGVVLLLGLGAVALWWSGRDAGDRSATLVPLGPVTVEVAEMALTDAGIDVVLVVDGVPADAVAEAVDTDTGVLVAQAAGPGPVRLVWTDAPSGNAALAIAVRRGDESEGIGFGLEIPPAVKGFESFNQWIMLLASLPTAERAERFATSVSDDIDGVHVLDSDDWPSLNPGFHVPYVGPFESGEAVLARCRELGREVPNDCAGRFLSTDVADRTLIAR